MEVHVLLCAQKAEGGRKDCEFLRSHTVRKMQKGGGDGRREGGRETERKREGERERRFEYLEYTAFT